MISGMMRLMMPVFVMMMMIMIMVVVSRGMRRFFNNILNTATFVVEPAN